MEGLLPGPVTSSSSVLRILLASPTRNLMEGGGISGIPTPSSLNSRSRSHSAASFSSTQQQQTHASLSAEDAQHSLSKEGAEESHLAMTNNLDTELSESKEKLKILSERLHSVSVSSTSSFNTRINGAAAPSLSLPPLPPSNQNGSFANAAVNNIVVTTTSPSSYTSSSTPTASFGISLTSLSALSPPRANMTSNVLSPSLVVTPASVESSALDTSTGGRRGGRGGREGEGGYEDSVDSSNAFLTTVATSPAARALEFERSLRLSHSRELAQVVDDSRRSLESERQKSAALTSQLRAAAETEAKLLKQLTDARTESLQNIARATAAADRAAEGERRASQREMGHLAQISETVAEMQRLRALAETAEASSRMAALMKSESEAVRIAEAAAHTLALERAQSSHVLAIERLNASHSAALAKALSEHRSALLEAEAQHHAALESVSKTASNAAIQAQTEKISLAHSHEMDVAALTARSAAALAEKEAEKSAAISALKSLHAEALSELNASHACEIESSNMSLLKELETENAAILSKNTLLHSNEVTELRLSHSLAMSQAKETHNLLVNEMKKEFSEEIAQVLLKEKKEREISETAISKSHNDAVHLLELSHKKNTADLHDLHKNEILSLQESHKRDINESAHSHALIVKDMKEKFEATQMEYRNEISNLQDLLNARDDELEARVNELNVLRVTSAASIDETRWTSDKKVSELTLQLDSAKSSAALLLGDFELVKGRLLAAETDLASSREQQASSNEEVASLKRDLAGAQQDVVSLRDRIRYQASSNEISAKEANEALQRALLQKDEAIKYAEMKRIAAESQFETKLKDLEVFYREESIRKEAALRLGIREAADEEVASSVEKYKATLEEERGKFQEALKNSQSLSLHEIDQLHKDLQALRSAMQHEKDEASHSLRIAHELFDTEKSILLSRLKDAQAEDALLRSKVNELEKELKERLADLMSEIARLVEGGQSNEQKIKAQAEADLAAYMREHKNAMDALNAELDSERKLLKEKTAAANVLAQRATRALLDVAQKQVAILTQGGS